MSENVEKINTANAKVNSIVVDKFITSMGFTPLDDFLIRKYRYSFLLAVIAALFFGSIAFILMKDSTAISSWFNVVVVVFVSLFFFFLSLFVYKALMVNMYVKVRRDIKSLREYTDFIKILLINSYQIFSYDDVLAVIKSVEDSNQTTSSFSLSNLFKLNGDDKVLLAISSFKLKKSSGQEKF